jgi:hypothetical protein
MEAVDPPSMVEVSGTALNMNDPVNDFLWVIASTGTGFGEQGTDTYNLQVATGQPFTLFGMDLGPSVITGQDSSTPLHSAVLLSNPAVTQPTTIDIDFSSPTASDTSFNTSFALPADSVLASTGVAVVNIMTASYFFTGGSFACAMPGSTFDCTGEIWDIGDPAAITSYRVFDPAHEWEAYGRSVEAWTQGAPQAGPVDLDFPNAPDVSTPTGEGPHPIDTPVQYTIADGGGVYTAEMAQINGTGRLIGLVTADNGAIVVPPLPSSSNPATHYESSMDFLVFTCRSDWGNYCTGTGMVAWEASPPAN